MRIFKKLGMYIAWPVRTIFLARGIARVRINVFFLLVCVAVATTYAWPTPFNRGIDWLNAKLEGQGKIEFVKRIKLPHPDQLIIRGAQFLRLGRIGFAPRADYRLGLDLDGGTHLVYQADFSNVTVQDKAEAMDGMRDVIERRVDAFGVTEPLVQVNKEGEAWRLVVELAGVHDTGQAIKMIGEAPLLEFKELDPQAYGKNPEELTFGDFLVTDLRGGEHLKRAQVQFDQTTQKPVIGLEFDSKGGEIFYEITKRNVNKPLAIFIDGLPISIPRVNEPISGGKAVITGNFTPEEAKYLARNLQAGSVSVPISLVSQQTIGASLGKETLRNSIKAALVGAILIAVFMILVYRLQGVLATLALGIYVVVLLVIFKVFSLTLTLAGIAGFILSLGMAVDGNILIFERMREERKRGRSFAMTVEEGFARAWTSIWDGNVSTLITAGILFWLGTGSIQGFGLTLILGTLVSMFSAIFVTKNLLKLFIGSRLERVSFLWK